MTSDRRLRIGGWAALLVALFVPLQFVLLFLGSRDPNPFSTTPYLVVETARIVAAFVAVVGLDGLFRSIAPGPARFVLAVGSVAGVIGLASAGATFAGLPTGAIDTVLFLAANVLLGAWFLGSGGILMREGGGLARVGWTAELGGLGMILTAFAIAVPFGGVVGVTGTSIVDWFHILGLFVVIYLVRIWRYVVGGKLPGPGIL